MTCPFCSIDTSRIFFEDDLIFGIWDLYPVSAGHALLISKRHVATWFDATPLEQSALLHGISVARDEIVKTHDPDGFNIGTNVGIASGQTVDHLHVHVIPRYVGDVPDPRGGVRHVVPALANYLEPKVEDQATAYPAIGAVSGTEGAPFLDALKRDLAESMQFDLAVAFVTEAGLVELQRYIEDLLFRGGKLRFLTGDYLNVTEPRALHQILDWQQEYASQVSARVFVTDSTGFHPKAYLLHKDHRSTAFIGSSNLTRHALRSGIEWNQRLASDVSDATLREINLEFESLFSHPNSVALSEGWIQTYISRRPAPSVQTSQGVDFSSEPSAPLPEPHDIQREALAALNASRADGNQAGLVVLATGLGKTWLSAFDSATFKRVLFVAHREEILHQALGTFRRIRPSAALGRYAGGEYDRDAEVVFASVQTLGRQAHLQKFAPGAFDYIVIDEFHHAAAATYRRIIDHFDPQFLMGMTATPERTDGGDLLALCGENLVFRCDLADGIERGLLSPFHYFGVPDEVDFANIPWRSGRFDPKALEIALATDRRAQNAYEQWQKRGGERTLAFCASQVHADFMKEYFAAKEVACVAVHSGASSAPRTQSLEKLEAGELQVVFSVDMFNEGVDVPTIDTVLMLRPTESKILWLQQFGRGLRKADGKSHLNVIDYIGNHRSFLQVPMLLFARAQTPSEILAAMQAYRNGALQLPAGCSVEYELEAIAILERLAQPSAVADQVTLWYQSFREIHGRRPSASEAYHQGYDPARLRRNYGSWLGFVANQGDLNADEHQAFETQRGFFGSLETTPMSKSYKMLVLLAMIARDAFPGAILIEDLVTSVGRIASRVRALRDEFGDRLDDPAKMKTLLESNPIRAWVDGAGTGNRSYFAYEDGRFSSLLDLAGVNRAIHQELAREICEWRLAQYLDRDEEPTIASAEPTGTQSKGAVMIGREYRRPDIPPHWNLEFSPGNWNAGYVKTDEHIFLLVSMKKRDLSDEHQYDDTFLDHETFRWVSQNKMSRSSPATQVIREHEQEGVSVHLFVRRDRKTPQGKAAPFTYCGEIDFMRWEGDRPITIDWRLRTPLTDLMYQRFQA